MLGDPEFWRDQVGEKNRSFNSDYHIDVSHNQLKRKGFLIFGKTKNIKEPAKFQIKTHKSCNNPHQFTP